MNYLLSMGSNLGDRVENLQQSLRLLNEFGHIERTSSYYRSQPYGETEQPNFINMVCLYQSGDRPHRLLRRIKFIELTLGRTRTYRWGPRLIDIDILDWSGEVEISGVLTVPHPELEHRDFFLLPLSEVVPGYISRNGRSISELIKYCPDSTKLEVINKPHED